MAIIAYSLAVALFIPLTAWAAAKFGTLTVFPLSSFYLCIRFGQHCDGHFSQTLVLARILKVLAVRL